MNKFFGHRIIALMALVLLCPPVTAQLKVWDGPVSGHWTDVFSWSPAGVPGANDSVKIGILAGTEGTGVEMENFITIENLELLNGANAFIRQNADIHVDGMTEIEGAFEGIAAQIYVLEPGANFQTTDLVIKDGGRITGPVSAQFQILDQMTLEVGGALDSNATYTFHGGNSWALQNDGVIEVQLTEMTLTQLGSGLLDLDGNTGGGTLKLNGRTQFGDNKLTVNGSQLNDAFSGLLVMGEGSVIDMNLTSGQWAIDEQAHVMINASSVEDLFPTRFQGADLIFSGTLSANDNPGNTSAKTRFDMPVSIQESAMFDVEDNNTLDFFGATTIHGGTFATPSVSALDSVIRFQGTTHWDGNVYSTGNLDVTGDAFVIGPTVIHAERINLDGYGLTYWNIQDNLVINAQVVDDQPDEGQNRFHGWLDIAGGVFSKLTVNLNGPEEAWEMAGVLAMSNNTPFSATKVQGTPILISGEVQVEDAEIRIKAETHWDAVSELNFIGPDTSLILDERSTIHQDATINGQGTLINGNSGRMTLGNGFFQNQVDLVNQGSLEFAEGAGLASVPGFTNTPDADVLFEVGGYVAGATHDLLAVSDAAATLGGRIRVKLIDAGAGIFAPSINDEFTVIAAPAGVAGQFTNSPVSVANGNGYVWKVIHNPFDVTLRLDSIIPDVILGDVNQDGLVNLLDVVPFIDLLTAGVYEIRGDINCDGVVNLLDVNPMVELLGGF